MPLSQTIESVSPASGVRRKTAIELRSESVREQAERALLAFLAKHGFAPADMPQAAQCFFGAWPKDATLAYGREVSNERVRHLFDEHPLLGRPTFELHTPEGKNRPARSCMVFVAEVMTNGRLERQLVAKAIIVPEYT